MIFGMVTQKLKFMKKAKLCYDTDSFIAYIKQDIYVGIAKDVERRFHNFHISN